MQFQSQTLGISEQALTLLRDLVHERTGLFFQNSSCDVLGDKLAPRVIECGFHSFLDYYYLLKYDSEAPDEWNRVMDALGVPETYFWREMDQIRALVDILVPRYAETQPGQPLRIWSAACCTGEEPLSIAMALNEAGWLERNIPIEIRASDASPRAIDRAKKGVYRGRDFRSLPVPLRDKYFQEDQGAWQVSPSLHARIHWSTVNLMSRAEVMPLATAPIIFCRNVFLYFSEDAIRQTVRLFAEHMSTPAYLFVGVSESLLGKTSEFELQEIGDAFVYVKQ